MLPPPAPLLVTLQANEGQNGPDITSEILWQLFKKDGGMIDEATPGFGDRMFEYLPGDYQVKALRPSDETWIEQDFSVVDENVSVIVVFPKILASATLDAPEKADAGSTIDVT